MSDRITKLRGDFDRELKAVKTDADAKALRDRWVGQGMATGKKGLLLAEMKALGVRSAAELRSIPAGKLVRIAGGVIARQRPGTAKGFVFLSLEDETGIANAIITPDLFEQNRFTIVREQFLLVEGRLEKQDNVISVRAERVLPLTIYGGRNHFA